MKKCYKHLRNLRHDTEPFFEYLSSTCWYDLQLMNGMNSIRSFLKSFCQIGSIVCAFFIQMSFWVVVLNFVCNALFLLSARDSEKFSPKDSQRKGILSLRFDTIKNKMLLQARANQKPTTVKLHSWESHLWNFTHFPYRFQSLLVKRGEIWWEEGKSSVPLGPQKGVKSCPLKPSFSLKVGEKRLLPRSKVLVVWFSICLCVRYSGARDVDSLVSFLKKNVDHEYIPFAKQVGV